MDKQTKATIEQTFQANIDRVQSLLTASERLGPDSGRPGTASTDVLRAGVVLLHASLEDLLRSSSEQLLPLQGHKVLAGNGLPDGADKTREKFSLGDLHA